MTCSYLHTVPPLSAECSTESTLDEAIQPTLCCTWKLLISISTGEAGSVLNHTPKRHGEGGAAALEDAVAMYVNGHVRAGPRRSLLDPAVQCCGADWFTSRSSSYLACAALRIN